MFAIARKVEDRLAHRLAGNRADVDADSTDNGFAFDHQDALSKLGALNRRVVAGRTGADYREIVIVIRHRGSCDPRSFSRCRKVATLPKTRPHRWMREVWKFGGRHSCRTNSGIIIPHPPARRTRLPAVGPDALERTSTPAEAIRSELIRD